MTSVNMPSFKSVPQNVSVNNKSSSHYLFASHPVADALVWGGMGMLAGTGVGVYNQHKFLKDKTRVDNAIDGVTKQIEEYKKSNKSVKKLEYSLRCLKNKKINFNSVKNWAFAIGLITFIPQVICNTLMWIGKKGYDKITGDIEGKN